MELREKMNGWAMHVRGWSLIRRDKWNRPCVIRDCLLGSTVCSISFALLPQLEPWYIVAIRRKHIPSTYVNKTSFSNPFFHPPLIIEETIRGTITTNLYIPASIPGKPSHKLRSPHSNLLSTRFQFASRIVEAAGAALSFFFDAPGGGVAAFSGGRCGGGFDDSTAGGFAIGGSGGGGLFARGCGCGFVAAGWGDGDLAGLDFCLELFGSFADFAELAFD